MAYIIVNIGCIECGVSSKIVGIFDTIELAEKVSQVLDEKYSWREKGQNSYEFFELPLSSNVIDPEYLPFLEGVF